MFVSWIEDKHSLHIGEIDTHHKELFVLTNQLSVLKEHPVKEQIILLLKRLYAYAKYHFSAEEAMFKQYAFPGAIEHKAHHGDFERQIKEWLADCRDDRPLAMNELMDFLINWIVGHIQNEDAQYALDFKSRGILPELFFKPSQTAQQRGSVQNDALELWQEHKLELDIKDIDTQHRELVNILQQANDLLLAIPERRRVFTPLLIQKLFYYSQYHFSFEEELLARNHYPNFIEHRKLHGIFIERIRSFADAYNLKVPGVNEEIVQYLKAWIIDHILKEDKQYKVSLTMQHNSP